jgi:uncharacterized protein (TIGR03437 family)
MRIVLVMALAAAIASGQFAEFAAPGDGSKLYFSSSLPLQGSNEPAQGRIFSVDATGVQTVADIPAVAMSPFPYTSYFMLSRPEASRDGSVAIYTSARGCYGSTLCESSMSFQSTNQTTIVGLAGGAMKVNGAGRISGNGRYLLLTVTLSPPSASALDLQTGQSQTLDPSIGSLALGTGRVVADDGTIVASQGSLLIAKGPSKQTIQFPGANAQQAAIDSSGQIVVYTQYTPSAASRYTIHLYNVAQQVDTTLFSQGDSTSPCVSADGTRAMFVSTASGLPQIWVVNTDGTGASQVSSDPTGVLTAVMSDDGQTAWYLSGSGRVIQLDLNSGAGQERIGRTPFLPPGGLPNRTEPRSQFVVNGVGFSDVAYSAAGYPLPLTLGGATVLIGGAAVPISSISPTQIVAQVPWETPTGAAADVKIVTTSSTPFAVSVSGGVTPLPGVGSFLLTIPTSPNSDALAIHQDWSALVTPSNPARPNEILHLYGLSFGPVASHPPTGMPAPTSPLASTVNPISCWAWAVDNTTQLNVPVLFSGLAPGVVGVYQLDIQLPPSSLRADTQVQCTGSGNDSEFFANFAVQQ